MISQAHFVLIYKFISEAQQYWHDNYDDECYDDDDDDDDECYDDDDDECYEKSIWS